MSAFFKESFVGRHPIVAAIAGLFLAWQAVGFWSSIQQGPSPIAPVHVWGMGAIEADKPSLPESSALRRFWSVEELLRKLRGDSGDREWVVEELGELGDARAIKPLIGVLDHWDSDVRREAVRALIRIRAVEQAPAQALGQLGDTRAVEPLLEDLGGKYGVGLTDTEQERIFGILSLFDSEVLWPHARHRGSCSKGAERVLRDREGGSLAMRVAITAWFHPVRTAWGLLCLIGFLALLWLALYWSEYLRMGCYPLFRRVEWWNLWCLASKRPPMRRKAAGALGRLGDKIAVEPLIKTLGDSEGTVRQAAAQALGELKDARAVEPLITALGDRDSAVRQAAAHALQQLGDTRAVKLLIELLGDRESAVRRAGVQALRQLGEPMWSELVQGDVEDFERLGQSGDPRAVEPLMKALDDGDSDVRQAAIQALVTLRAVEPLIQTLSKRDSDVRRGVAQGLGELKDARAVEPLIKTLADSKSAVRQAAIQALGELKDARVVKPLIEVFGDREEAVRQAGAEVLRKLLGKLTDHGCVKLLVDALGRDSLWQRGLLDAIVLGALNPGLREAVLQQALSYAWNKAAEKLSHGDGAKAALRRAGALCQALQLVGRGAPADSPPDLNAKLESWLKGLVGGVEKAREWRREDMLKGGGSPDGRVGQILKDEREHGFLREALRQLWETPAIESVSSLQSLVALLHRRISHGRRMVFGRLDEQDALEQDSRGLLAALGACAGRSSTRMSSEADKLARDEYRRGVGPKIEHHQQLVRELEDKITQHNASVEVATKSLGRKLLSPLALDGIEVEGRAKSRGWLEQSKAEIETLAEQIIAVRREMDQMEEEMLRKLSPFGLLFEIATGSQRYEVPVRQGALCGLARLQSCLSGDEAQQCEYLLEQGLRENTTDRARIWEVRPPPESTTTEVAAAIRHGMHWLGQHVISFPPPSDEGMLAAVSQAHRQLPKVSAFLEKHPLRLMRLEDRLQYGNCTRDGFTFGWVTRYSGPPSAGPVEERYPFVEALDKPNRMGLAIEVLAHPLLLLPVLYHEYLHAEGLLNEAEVHLREILFLRTLVAELAPDDDGELSTYEDEVLDMFGGVHLCEAIEWLGKDWTTSEAVGELNEYIRFHYGDQITQQEQAEEQSWRKLAELDRHTWQFNHSDEVLGWCPAKQVPYFCIAAKKADDLAGQPPIAAMSGRFTLGQYASGISPNIHEVGETIRQVVIQQRTRRNVLESYQEMSRAPGHREVIALQENTWRRYLRRRNAGSRICDPAYLAARLNAGVRQRLAFVFRRSPIGEVLAAVPPGQSVPPMVIERTSPFDRKWLEA